MAIYHLSIKTISRSSGRSSVAASAYRSGERLHDERLGLSSDYTRKQGVVHTEIVAPAGSPSWAQDRAALWNAAEVAERRKNSTTAREYEIALPAELSPTGRQEAARNFAGWLTRRFGVVADIAIHEPGREGDQRNHHAHILTTTRKMEADGLTVKTRELDDRRSGAVEEVRAEWARVVNAALVCAAKPDRVDHRSHAAREIEDAPGVHLGPAACAIERRGRRHARGERNRFAQAATKTARLAREALDAAQAVHKSRTDEAAEIAQAEAILREQREIREAEKALADQRRRRGRGPPGSDFGI